ncbi:MAG: hypothetical protein LBN22_09820 [Clostridiales Family XIII bacterium]|jgi:hypothetical protein|nr:hypothetical protein [Clostridiales Family XIII bacterium]
MGHLGFSYIGLVFLLMLIIPNLIWVRNQPQTYDSSDENRILSIFERVGQALVTVSVLIFSDFNPQRVTAWTLWFFAAAVSMLLYEFWWIRYFKSEKTWTDFYSSFCGIPVAGATLPVFAFLLLGVYGKVVWLIIAAVIFGIGHIGIHLQHKRGNNEERSK